VQFTLLCGAKNFFYCCVYSHSSAWCWLPVVVHTVACPLGGSSYCPPHHLNTNSLTCISEACSAHITLLFKVHRKLRVSYLLTLWHFLRCRKGMSCAETTSMRSSVRQSISPCIFDLVPVTINTLSHFHELWYSK
jgi:hypothetical protein